ncbi:unnamed protein product [Candidula unifasciata]|uniref:3-hydroxy-3-methylglutaryl coenzyme A reductase n=1 Tax=Candidula unifasciata TaxID=100452 RepID=A0A8S4A030_9EUPU|nr:unnamed protein product [Candidula unifasciata]
MLSRLFDAHGQLCAGHPWEVLIATVTVTTSLMSMSLWATNRNACGWNHACTSDQETKISDVVILSLTRYLAVIYIYFQFRNLRKLGSKYLLGLAGVFTICSSFIFSVAIANLVGFDFNGLNEALPFFLLLVDLSKTGALSRFTLTAANQDELQKNIGRGMAVIGPAITLDVLVETLAIGVGTLSGVPKLETLCCFGCLSVIANYLAFMTFYPACLSLILEISQGRVFGKPLRHLQQLSRILQKEEEETKPNPVTQRVKIIMSFGLVLVHAHSRLASETAVFPGSHLAAVSLLPDSGDQCTLPRQPLWQFYVGRFLTSHLDYGLALILTLALGVKYVFFDDHLDQVVGNLLKDQAKMDKQPLEVDKQPLGVDKQPLGACVKNSYTSETCRMPLQDSSTCNHKTKPAFYLGSRDTEDNFCDERFREDKKIYNNKQTQTDSEIIFLGQSQFDVSESGGHCLYKLTSAPARSRDECLTIMNSEHGAEALTDEEVLMLVKSRDIPAYKLENVLDSYARGVAIRRQMLVEKLPSRTALDSLPYLSYDYKYVDGACCENVIGYMPVPVGVAGPLLLDGRLYYIPMATTEGCLVASTNRGCRALEQSGGVTSNITNDGMTRGPVVRFPTAMKASASKRWLEDPDNFVLMKKWFDTTSRFARLKKLHVGQAGRSLYLRFVSTTGDAMGMNMLSKGVEKCLNRLQDIFPDMDMVSLSGNFCTDKKPAAINWIEGRGKSVVCEAVVKSHVVRNVLKTTVPALVDLNISKNLVGSVMAGSIGGFNAHASNIVTAIYIATGQDPAQNVTSSNCIILMEASGPYSDDLHITCTMPSIEVGTVGGGTVLPPQAACLEMLEVKGSHVENPGENAQRFARIVCASVLAGELSLMSALASGHLVKSHMKHNRSTINMAPTVTSPTVSFPGTCISQVS